MENTRVKLIAAGLFAASLVPCVGAGASAAEPVTLTTPALGAKGAVSAPPVASDAPIELKTPALGATGSTNAATVDASTGTIELRTPPLKAAGQKEKP